MRRIVLSLALLGLAAPAIAAEPDPRVKDSARAALDYLARTQTKQGYWTANGNQYRVAMTALAGAGPHVAGDPLAAADPQGALRAALLGQVDPALRAEEILLGWLLRLADGVDPAVAAGHVMEAVDRGALRNGRLLDLLAEVASWPASRLARLEPGGKRH